MSDVKRQYVIIRDMSAGNSETGEAWQETKIFNSQATLHEVMLWAMGATPQELARQWRSSKRIQITMPEEKS